MFSKKALITIGITAFNEGDLLLDAWNSVISQTDSQWFAVMILDGDSNFKTKTIFNSIKHPNLIKFSYKENQGVYNCRSKAIELTETDWYFHLDADDTLPYNAINLVDQVIQKNPKIEFVGGACKHIGIGYDTSREPINNINQLTKSPLFFAQAPIKKKMFQKLGGYFIPNHFFHSDWDFWLSVHEKNIKGIIIDQILYKRRNRNNSITWKNLEYLELGLEVIISRHPKYFNTKEKLDMARGNLYQNLARQFRTIGKRKIAAKYVTKAEAVGFDMPVFKSIINENNMNYLRYLIRRLGRYLT